MLKDFFRAGLELLGKNYIDDEENIPPKGWHTCLVIGRGPFKSITQMTFFDGKPVLSYYQGTSTKLPLSADKNPVCWSIAKDDGNGGYLTYIISYNKYRFHSYCEENKNGERTFFLYPIADLDALQNIEIVPRGLHLDAARIIQQRRNNRFYGNESGSNAAQIESNVRFAAVRTETLLNNAQKILASAGQGSFHVFQSKSWYDLTNEEDENGPLQQYAPTRMSMRQLSMGTYRRFRLSTEGQRIFSNPLLSFVR